MDVTIKSMTDKELLGWRQFKDGLECRRRHWNDFLQCDDVD
jgi:hypothetical protein